MSRFIRFPHGSRLRSMRDTLRPWLLLTLLHIIRVSKVQSIASNHIVFMSDYVPPKSSQSNLAYSNSMRRQLNVSISQIFFFFLIKDRWIHKAHKYFPGHTDITLQWRKHCSHRLALALSFNYLQWQFTLPVFLPAAFHAIVPSH